MIVASVKELRSTYAVLGEIFKDRKDQELKVELRGIASDVEEKLRSCQ